MMTFNLLNAAMAALSASTALAARQDPVALVGEITAISFDEARAVPEEMVHAPVTPSTNLQPMVSDLFERGSDDWEAYKDLPMVGTLKDTSNNRVFTIGAYYRDDKRDVNSLYACVSKETHKPVVLLHHPAGEGEAAGGVLLEVVENKTNSARGVTDGWFLAVHAAYAADTKFKGAVRVIAHRDPAKAAIWKYEKVNDKTVLKLVDSRDATSGPAQGGYLMVPDGAKRDSQSDFVAVAQISNGDGLAIEFNGA